MKKAERDVVLKVVATLATINAAYFYTINDKLLLSISALTVVICLAIITIKWPDDPKE